MKSVYLVDLGFTDGTCEDKTIESISDSIVFLFNSCMEHVSFFVDSCLDNIDFDSISNKIGRVYVIGSDVNRRGSIELDSLARFLMNCQTLQQMQRELDEWAYKLACSKIKFYPCMQTSDLSKVMENFKYNGTILVPCYSSNEIFGLLEVNCKSNDLEFVNNLGLVVSNTVNHILFIAKDFDVFENCSLELDDKNITHDVIECGFDPGMLSDMTDRIITSSREKILLDTVHIKPSVVLLRQSYEMTLEDACEIVSVMREMPSVSGTKVFFFYDDLTVDLLSKSPAFSDFFVCNIKLCNLRAFESNMCKCGESGLHFYARISQNVSIASMLLADYPTYSINQVVKLVSVSYSTLNTYFKAVFGICMSDYCQFIHFDNACLIMTNGKHSLEYIAREAGFSNCQALNTAFYRYKGCKASDYYSNSKIRMHRKQFLVDKSN